jgi:hypothetical protein
MADIAHHPPYRPPARAPAREDQWREAVAAYRAGINGTWVASFLFGLIVTLSALVFLVPMAIWP